MSNTLAAAFGFVCGFFSCLFLLASFALMAEDQSVPAFAPAPLPTSPSTGIVDPVDTDASSILPAPTSVGSEGLDSAWTDDQREAVQKAYRMIRNVEVQGRETQN